MRSRGFFLLLLAAARLVAADAPPAATREPIPETILGTWTGQARADDLIEPIGFQFFRAQDGVRVGAKLWLPPLNVYGTVIGEVVLEGGKLSIPAFGTPLQLGGDELTGNLYQSELTFTVRRGGELPSEPALPADTPTGPAPAWMYAAGAPIWATPTVHDGVAYFGDQKGMVHAVDCRTGRAIWIHDTGAAIFGDVTVDGEFLFLVNDSGHLLKLARRDGTEMWRAPLGGAGVRSLPSNGPNEWDFASPAPVVDRGTVYVGSADHHLYALAAADGRERWRFATTGKVRSAASLAGERVLVGSMDRFVYALEKDSGKLVWRFDTGGPVTTRGTIVGDRYIVGTRDAARLYALDVATGHQRWDLYHWMSWVESAPVLADDGFLYIGSSDSRRVRCLEPGNGKTRWAAQVWGWTWGTPLVHGDTVYFGTAGAPEYFISQRPSLGALDRATGRLKWRQTLPLSPDQYLSGLAGSAALAPGHVLFALLDGTLRAYPLP